MITKCENETRKLGEKIAKKLTGGEVIGLVGDLGAGKTIFAQGLAKGLGIKKTINSPTFVLMRNYKVKGKKVKFFCHLDCYRLNDPQALVDIGIKDYLGQPDTVCVVEWADKTKKILPKQVKWIRFFYGKKKQERIIRIIF
ncbi:MAG: tRNA (adenosine(37)-N6)-threonylcarbamoyltransferase complex ATPase subunit type 1 TsaE [bacterium]